MDYLKMNKWAKWIAYGIMTAFVVVFIALCIAVGVKNKTIKSLKAKEYDQTEYVANLRSYADSLAKLNCITVTANVIVNQKGLVNMQQATQISKSVATATREEVLHALDTLNKQQ